MTEMGKTATFAACGVVAAFAAWASRPDYSDATANAGGGAGEVMFAQFDDPFSAASLNITQYNDELGEISTFEVAQKDGSWVIPSHDDYPADADKNFKDAAMLLVGLKAIDVVSESRGDHELYGVKAPDPSQLSAGDKGVGKMLEFKDGNGSRLAELIIGDTVKGNEEQRYVRRPSDDRTYIAEIDPTKISTEFDAWIKDDLLELSAFDVQQIELRDYSTQSQLTSRGIAVAPEQRFFAKVNWTDQSKWELAELSEFRNGKLEPTELLETEELNTTTLNDMKSALDDLTIVDVRRKPEGLKADLSTDQGFSQDRETLQSLLDLGFYPASTPDGSIELLSSEGEVLCRTKDGAEYTLRFGKVAIGKDESTLNRFVMVTAALNENALLRPELEDLPKEPAADNTDNSATDNSETDNSVSNDTASNDTASNDTATNDKTATDGEDAASDSDTAKPDTAKPDTAAVNSDLDAERDRITKENQRKLDDYNDKRQKAVDRVGELNLRFAPWYYVISEDVYKKLHLSRSDLLKEKEGAEKLDNSVNAFRDLESKGLEKEDGAAAPNP